MESFRSPNFELVADLLYWMVGRYDPAITVHEGIETEEDRVSFLASIARPIFQNSCIRLNLKMLYKADGYAVKELSKIASVLCQALESVDDDEDCSIYSNENPEEIRIKLHDVKYTKNQASNITEKGAKLYDLIRAEEKDIESKEQVLNFLDALTGNLESTCEHDYVERNVSQLVETIKEDVGRITKQNKNFESEEKILQDNIKKKQTDIERKQRRLQNLQNAQPEFMEEYEKVESELQQQYELYIERFRNLDFLEKEIEVLECLEKEKLDEADKAMKRVQRKLQEEEFQILRGDPNASVDIDDYENEKDLYVSADEVEEEAYVSKKSTSDFYSASEPYLVPSSFARYEDGKNFNLSIEEDGMEQTYPKHREEKASIFSFSNEDSSDNMIDQNASNDQTVMSLSSEDDASNRTESCTSNDSDDNF